MKSFASFPNSISLSSKEVDFEEFEDTSVVEIVIDIRVDVEVELKVDLLKTTNFGEGNFDFGMDAHSDTAKSE